ncbi:MAG: DMT family transporter [Sulfuritalea sp.]|nr:DMT family transporter [Sulfuritalea sp.]
MSIAPRTWFKLLIVAFFWGATWVAGRIAVAEVSPLATASWRFLLAALVLGLVLYRKEGIPRWQARDWIGVSQLGASGIFLYNVCFLYGMRYIEAGRGALVVALTPAVIALADWALFAAPMTARRFIGIVIAMLGCLLVVTRGDVNLLTQGAVGAGELLILGCVVLWSTYTFIGRRVNRTISPLAATFGACLTGWVMLTIAALIDGSLFVLQTLRLDGALSILFLGVLGTALSFTWYAEAVRDIGPTRAGMFINLVPVFGVLLGALMLQERLAAVTYAGGALVMLGVLTLNWPSNQTLVATVVEGRS